MSQKIQIDKENRAVLLFNKSKQSWEDRTMMISTMFEAHCYGKFTGYNIYFKGTGKYFFYTTGTVQFLNKVNNVNIDKQDIYVDGKVVNAIKVNEFEKGYYRVYTDKATVFTKNVNMKKNNIFSYYSRLADYAGSIAEENSPLYYLSQNYKSITLSSDSVLFDYFQSQCNLIGSTELLIVPFDFNQSQIKAIETALKNKISVIEGPPGTGKTQTILNLIANILYCGRNCAVVSNNNTAIDSLDKDSDNVDNGLYDFVTNEQLLNVAISRGRNKVTAIVADKVYHSSNNAIHDFIKYAEYLYGSDIVKVSTITSAFDVLYSEYTTTLLSNFHKQPNHYKTELLMCNIINQVLCHHNLIGYAMHIRLSKLVNVPDTFNEKEKRYILHPWTHVDFFFYNKVSKEKLFVLEVDGIRYHEQNKKQAIHDDIKNRVLQSNNIPVFRFKTNESNEKQRLTEIINGYSH
jgi:hypothetical protein